MGWLQETLRKEQKLFWSYSFFLEKKFSEKAKEHYEKKKSENVLYLILGALVTRGRSNFC